MQTIHSHNNFIIFTVSLIFLLLVSAIVSSTADGEYHMLLQAVVFATELVAYLSLSLSRKWRVFIVFILILNATVTMLREFGDWDVAPRIGLAISIAFYSGMAYVAARQVLFTGSNGKIEFNTIVGTLAVYLLLGIVWTCLYLFTLEFWPEGIKGIEYRDWHDNFNAAAYYSFVTMTSLGYGDITPTVPVTRTLAYLQAITGTFYMAVVVASLVATYISRPR